jgi:trk system potassium uptake protein TrkH
MIEPEERRRVLLPPGPAALLAITGGFTALILLGTIVLWLPISSAEPGHADFVTALFTATSAVCVTGLVVVDSAAFWSPVGQTALVVMMFMGGLGIMTAGLVVLVAIGRRITLNQRLVVRDSMGAASLGGVVKLGRYVILFALAVQGVGFVVLFLRLLFQYSAPKAAWHSLFHSVSAFNNAGFTIFEDSDSLSRFDEDPLTLAILGVLIVLGSISFPVVAELMKRVRPNRWSLDTRLVILGTVGLWVLGAASMLLFEIGNPSTLGNEPFGSQITNASFQAITARTAGFSTIDFSATRPGNDFLFMLLMFIGGASGSAAGGIKVNTAMVLLAASLASINGRPRAEVLKRELAYAQVSRALALLLLATTALFFIAVALAVTEVHQIEQGKFTFLDVLFESASAFGTSGLSRGITSLLTEPGKIVVTLAMIAGRLGPLTIALGLALHERRAIYRFAEERVRIG